MILCTGFSEGVTEEMIREKGIIDLVMKPMIASELAKKVRDALDRKPET